MQANRMMFHHPAFIILLAAYSLTLFGCASASTVRDSAEGGIDRLFTRWADPRLPGGSVLVIKDGEAVYRRAFGAANLEERVPNTPSTNFRLASVTKQFTAMSVMILEEQGKLGFDDILPDFFPDFPPYGRKITVRHLLQHTSGLIDYENVTADSTTVPLLDRDVLMLMKRQDSTYFAPGSRHRYSNSGYALLALIVEKVSARSFATFLKEKIFDPLGMSSTVAYEKGISTISKRAYGYTRRDSSDERSFERTDQSMTSSVLGDGGIYSSVEDLFKWDQALSTSRLVSVSTLNQALTPNVLPNGENTAYGFGWRIFDHRGLRCFHHSGSTVGFRTRIVRFPQQRLTVIVLANRSDDDLESTAFKVADLFLIK